MTIRRALIASFLLVAFPAGAFAGGGGFGMDEDEDTGGPPFFGIVKDQAGASVPDTKITATIAKMNSSLVLRSDATGHFFIKGFDKSVDPADVEIACSKDGYRPAIATKTPAAGMAPIQAVCVLQHE